MDPETAPSLFQLKVTGSAPESVAPVPVPMVVQPAASAISSGSPSFTIECLTSFLLLPPANGIAAGQARSVLAPDCASTSRPVRKISAVMRADPSRVSGSRAAGFAVRRACVGGAPFPDIRIGDSTRFDGCDDSPGLRRVACRPDERAQPGKRQMYLRPRLRLRWGSHDGDSQLIVRRVSRFVDGQH